MTPSAANLVDWTLETSVVGSFTRIGYHTRRCLFHWTPLDSLELEGKIAIVTGATSGLGRAAAEIFGEDRVSVVPDLAEAIDRAATLAEAGEAIDVSIGAGAVLVTGSVVTVGEAPAMLKGRL